MFYEVLADYCDRMLEYAINSTELQQPLWSFAILQAICWCFVA